MNTTIHVEAISPHTLKFDSAGMARRELLPGEIAGASTFALRVAPGASVRLPEAKDEMIILCLLEGDGEAASGEKRFPVFERSVFVPAWRAPVTLSAGTAALIALEIRWRMSEADADDLAKAANRLPWFAAYSSCTTYKEAIKSPKTVNRTLVPENIVPRFCMGSVETEGPDAVGAHRHPMLEQHFFGLAENEVWVKADQAETRLGGNTLLHIPLGSEHSVRVEAGCRLHYLWLDYFMDRKGLEWIRKMHTNE